MNSAIECCKDQEMDKVYHSKVDCWLGLVIGVAVIVNVISSVALLVSLPHEGLPAFFISLARS